MASSFYSRRSFVKERISLRNGFSDNLYGILFHLPYKIGISNSVYVDLSQFRLRQPVVKLLFYFDFKLEPHRSLRARFYGLGESCLHQRPLDGGVQPSVSAS
jgi:hypothetical protein